MTPVVQKRSRGQGLLGEGGDVGGGGIAANLRGPAGTEFLRGVAVFIIYTWFCQRIDSREKISIKSNVIKNEMNVLLEEKNTLCTHTHPLRLVGEDYTCEMDTLLFPLFSVAQRPQMSTECFIKSEGTDSNWGDLRPDRGVWLPSDR